MKNEESLHELLCAYVLGETTPEQAARVEAELESNETLRDERARLEATIGLVQRTLGTGAGDEALSPGAHAELMDRAGLRRAPATWRRVVSHGGFRAAAAVLVLATGAAVLLERTSTEDARSRPAPDTLAAVEPEMTKASREAGRWEKVDRGGAEELLGARYSNDAEAKRAKVDSSAAAAAEPPAAPTERPSEPLSKNANEPKDGRVARELEAGEQPLDRAQGELLRDLGYLGDEGEGRQDDDYDDMGLAATPAADDGADRVEKFVKAGVGGKAAAKETSPTDVSPAPHPDPPATVSAGGSGGSVVRSDGGPGGPAGPPSAAGPTASGNYDRRVLAGEPRKREDEADAATLGLRRQATGEREFEAPTTSRDLDALLHSCRRRPNETPSMMFFRFWGDNAFEYTITDALSTFSVDVDTASYALARNYLAKGMVPPKEAVRTEEFVNYFDADVPPPLEGDFAIHTDLAPSLFGGGDPNRWMLRVVVRGREVAAERRQPLALTFVVDTSGSMQQENRMELVKHALRLLIGELDANDSIALVAFSRDARQVLPMTSVANRSTIEVAINGLRPSGSTNGEAGLKLGYATADDAARGAENVAHRVVFLSDGVVNTGETDQARILADIAAHKARGIYLNTIGVGMGNHNDVFLEQLADKGDGVCNYVDSAREAHRAIVENFVGAFQPIARDVKVQVEFDPKQVESYRLLGYENRAVRDADFRNDAVDAGEVGAGHQVTALYELVRIPSGSDTAAPLAVARLRWKPPHGSGAESPETATELAHELRARDAAGSFAGTSAGYRRAVLVAQFAELLRRSVHARGDSLDTLIDEAKRLERELEDDDFTELVLLLERSRQLILHGLAPGDELTRAVDELRRHYLLQARYEALLQDQKAEDQQFLEELEKQNQELEDKIRELLRRKRD